MNNNQNYNNINNNSEYNNTINSPEKTNNFDIGENIFDKNDIEIEE